IEMPRAVNDTPRPRAQAPSRPAPVEAIRVASEARPRSRVWSIAAGVLACMAFITVFRESALSSRLLARQAAARQNLPFTAQDDYESIVRRLGLPARDDNQPDRGVRRLWYPQHAYTLVLKGRDHPHYAGAIDAEGRVIHLVRSSR